MYGQPDLIGDWDAGMTAFYWERNGYYIGVEAQTLPEANYMVMSYATYVPATVWDFYSNEYLEILGWPPLTPYGQTA